MWLVVVGLLFMLSVMWWMLVCFMLIGVSMWKKVSEKEMFGKRLRLKFVLLMVWMIFLIWFFG